MKVNIDIIPLVTDVKKLHKNYGRFIALGTRELVLATQKTVRQETERNFDLATNWIPNNIRAFPKTQGQVNKVENDVMKHHDFTASVSTTEKIHFMAGHEYGTLRNPEDGGSSLALPSFRLQMKYSHRKPQGPIKDKWKPAKLLEYYNSHPNKGAPRPGKASKHRAFIMRAKSGHMMIVRRSTIKSRPIEVLYHFQNSAKIAKEWNFYKSGLAKAKNSYSSTFKRHWRIQSSK